MQVLPTARNRRSEKGHGEPFCLRLAAHSEVAKLKEEYTQVVILQSKGE